jgi:small-conductance mechanosensitive channel
MNEIDRDIHIDITPFVAKPLYFAMAVNMVIPMALLFVCYYINEHFPFENQVGEFANFLFYILCGMTLVDAGIALWWRSRLFSEKLVNRQETFEADLLAAIVRKTRPIFLIVAAISLYGVLYYFLTARFVEALLFVVFSFLVFQVVRPREGMMRKIIAAQRRHLERK